MKMRGINNKKDIRVIVLRVLLSPKPGLARYFDNIGRKYFITLAATILAPAAVG